jgi:DNA-binding NtrC family response regulator
MATVQIIDDEPEIRRLLRMQLERMGQRVVESVDGNDGIVDYRAHRPSLVFCDISMPGPDGLEVLERLRAIDPGANVIVMSGASTTERAIRAMSLGACEYLVKPFDPRQAMTIARQILADGAGDPPRRAVEPVGRNAIVGRSKAICEVSKWIGRTSQLDTSVLILGESGTGKELVARAIHEYGPRKHGPLVAINCAAIPDSLLETELFGHEKGAFSGADRQRAGKFELANNGTLFLDEIGEMSPAVQAKILRVLQDQEFYRVGGNELVRTNARIVAATNRELLGTAGRNFREDLYYRLSTSIIRIPPLRERREDIPCLVDHFLRIGNAEQNRSVAAVSTEAMQRLVRHEWRGNIRELANTLRQAVALSYGRTIPAEHFDGLLPVRGEEGTARELFCPAEVQGRVAAGIAAGKSDILAEMLAAYERAILDAAIRECEGNLSRSAKHLGIHRITLKTKLEGRPSSMPQAEPGAV